MRELDSDKCASTFVSVYSTLVVDQISYVADLEDNGNKFSICSIHQVQIHQTFFSFCM